ncbi:MAG: DUF4203 domain-containing protein [Acidobacteriota bacterium]
MDTLSRIRDAIGEILSAYGGTKALVLVLWGLMSCFLGYRIFKFVLALTGFLIGGLLGAGIAWELTGGATTWVVAAGAVGGVVLSLLAFPLYSVGFFFFGALAALLLAWGAFLATGATPPLYLPWVAALVGGIVAVLAKKLMLILSTSFAGAWMSVTGAAQLLGLNSNALDLSKGLRDIPEPGSTVTVLLLSWIVLGFIGLFVQYSGKSRKKTAAS